MVKKYTRAQVRYAPPSDEAKRNYLWEAYIKPRLHDINLKEADETVKLNHYVADRFGIPPRIPSFKEHEIKRPDEILLKKVSKVMKPYIYADPDNFNFAKSPEFKLSSVIMHSVAGQIIILHGDIGSGKSTLLTFVTNKILPKLFPEGYVVLRIDALTAARYNDLNKLSPKDLTKAVVTAMDSELLDSFTLVKDTFFEQLAKPGTTVWNILKENNFAADLEYFNTLKADNPSLFKKTISDFVGRMVHDTRRLQYNIVRFLFLKNQAIDTENEFRTQIRKYQRCLLVFDNIDKTDIKTKEATIDIAKHFATLLNFPVIITLRSRQLDMIYKTYWNRLNEIREINAVTLYPPDLSHIVKKRFQIYLKAVRSTRLKYRGKTFSSKQGLSDVTTKLSNLLVEQQKAKELLLALHNGDIRLTVNGFLRLLGSPPRLLPLERLIMELFDETEDFPFVTHRLPYDYLLEMVALNRRTIYNPKTSLLSNIYNCNYREHQANIIVKPRILSFLDVKEHDETSEILLADIIEHLVSVFDYPQKLILTAMHQLIQQEILWSREGKLVQISSPKGDDEHGIITKIQTRIPYGVYNKLKTFLWYVCLVKENCLVPEDIAEKISFRNYEKKRAHPEKYYLEIRHTLNFVDYIKTVELEELSKISGDNRPQAKNDYVMYYGYSTITEGILKTFKQYFRKKRDHVINAMKPKKDDKKDFVSSNTSTRYRQVINQIDKMLSDVSSNARTYLE